MELMAASRSGDQTTPAATFAYDSDAKQRTDVWLAEIVAGAICSVPGVAVLEQGRGVAVATYGRGRTVNGVAVRRVAGDKLEIDVCVVVAEVEAVSLMTPSNAGLFAPSIASVAVLSKLAETIRERVVRALGDVALGPPISVDVYFDDLV